MPLYDFSNEGIQALHKTTFDQVKLYERRDLQPLLREKVSVISPNTLVIAEEFGEWDGSRRRIDLLGIDRDANLVVIELKRTEDGGHMELQAVRYAAMVSTMTFDKAVDVFGRHLAQSGRGDLDARAELLNFLGWDEPDEDAFAQDVRIVLASAEFSRELTTSVLWLADRAIDIRCVRLQPYDHAGRILVDVQQIIPPPEAAAYQIQVREKVRKEREARVGGADYTRYDLTLGHLKIVGEVKRRAIYKMFRYVVENAIEPEIAAEYCGARSLVSVDGEVGHEKFVALADEDKARQGRKFDPIRFFCNDDELLRLNGRTYAFSNQWTKQGCEAAMTNLRAAFPDLGITFSPSAF